MPDWTAEIRRHLDGLRVEGGRELEIVEELSTHLDDRFAELLEEGMSPTEARRLALTEIADHELLRRELRPLRQASTPRPLVPGAGNAGWFSGVTVDLRYAWRTLRKQPVFAAAVIATLGLGIGANAIIFSLVSATLLRQLPAHSPETLAYAYNGQDGNVFPYPTYAALRDGATTVQGLAAWGGITASLNADGDTDMVSGAIVTGNFFSVLGAAAGQGRLLGPPDDRTVGGHPVAVISDRLWRVRFGTRADVVGHDVLLNGHRFTIVGVTTPGFVGAQVEVVHDLYVPMMMQAVMRPPRAGYSGEMNPDLLRNPRNGWLMLIARLADRGDAPRVAAELSTLAANVARAATPPGEPRRVLVVPVDEANATARARLRSVAWLLGGVVGAVLLIACANVANLLLSRATARRRELAVRLAIGASRARLLRQLLTESLMLSLIGGAFGVAIAWTVARVFAALPPPAGALPMTIDVAVDRRVLVFSAVLSLITGIAFGLLPALAGSRPSLVPALKDGPSPDRGRRALDLKRLLVVTQVAVSLVLLVAAGLFLRSLQAASAIDPGIEVARLLSAPLNINLLRYTRAQGRTFYQQAVDRVGALPGVERAAVARVALFGGGLRVLDVLVEGRAGSTDQVRSESGQAPGNQNQIRANVVDDGFFDTLGIALRAGRGFAAGDREGSTPVTVLNHSAAERYFPGEDPIGKRVSFNALAGPWVEIVGIVEDSDYAALGEPPAPVAYLPLSQNHETGMVLYVRTTVAPETVVASIRHELRSLEPNLPVPEVQPMAVTIGTSLYTSRMGATLLAIFGGLALLLAAVGVYGVLAFSAARRSREIGIRMALGASRRSVFEMVAREGLMLVSLGAVLGVAGALAVTRSFGSLLYGTSTYDITSFVLATVTLGGVAAIACSIPARRATRVDPLLAIRTE